MPAMGEGDRVFNLSALTRKLKTIEHGIKPGETDGPFVLYLLSLQLLATRKQLYFQFIQNLHTNWGWEGGRCPGCQKDKGESFAREP